MKLLVDTLLVLWTLDDSPRLTPQARERLTADGTECYVSAISFWEIAIKASLRRTAFRIDLGKLMAGVRDAEFRLLAFEPEHALRVARLARHHVDPFDRALVAQAQAERIRLLTHDAALARYGSFVTLV
jgi:PIN domain nuclease of toxin-antitoxin system